MPDEETLDRRLRAVERTLTDGEDVESAPDSGALADRVETLEAELVDARDRITELEAATQALRGYVGNVRSVNEDVERRADAALAAVERVEARTNGTQPGEGRGGEDRSGRGRVDRNRVGENRAENGRHEGSQRVDRTRRTRDGRSDDCPAPSSESERPRREPRVDGGSGSGSDPDAEEDVDDGSLVRRFRDAIG